MKNKIRILRTFIRLCVFPNSENKDLKKKLGISYFEQAKLLNSNQEYSTTLFYGKEIIINDPFWYFHSLKEIFLENTYRFCSSNPSPTILDCGANIGMSIIYFKKMFPTSKVIAFEPDKGIYQSLQKNISSFEFDNVTLLRKAVWKADELLNFGGDTSVGGTLDIRATHNVKAEVEAVTLKPYLRDQQIDFLKIDIEGAEFEVLKDIINDLANVKNIFIEYHSNPKSEQYLPELLLLLKSVGYRIYIKEAWNNMPEPFLYKKYNPFWDLQLNIFGFRED